jgi:hypothetical protein
MARKILVVDDERKIVRLVQVKHIFQYQEGDEDSSQGRITIG